MTNDDETQGQPVKPSRNPGKMVTRRNALTWHRSRSWVAPVKVGSSPKVSPRPKPGGVQTQSDDESHVVPRIRRV